MMMGSNELTEIKETAVTYWFENKEIKETKTLSEHNEKNVQEKTSESHGRRQIKKTIRLHKKKLICNEKDIDIKKTDPETIVWQ